MNDNSTPIGLSNPDASGRSSGELLRAARESQGLSLEHLAATLKVTPAKLSALEDGRLEQLPDASFARALAQTMCRVLKIDPVPVLAGLPAARVASLAGDKPALNQPFKEARLAPKMFEGSGDGLLVRLLRPQWLTPILLLVAAAVIYVLPDSFEWPSWQGSTQSADPVASQASAVEQTADGLLPVPAASDALVLDPVASAASDSAVSPSASAASEVAPNVLAAATDASSAVVAPVPPVVAATVAQPAAALVKPSADAPVALVVTEDSWIEVVDGDGNTRLSRIVRAGESMAMGGVAPWRVRIGHVGGVKVTLRGQPVDLTPFARNNVARLELK